MINLPTPEIERIDRFWVVRDDKIPGGTKQIALQASLPGLNNDHFVYTASAFGKGGPALAFACKALGFKATLFLASGTDPVWLKDVEETGATIVRTDPLRVQDIEPLAYAHAFQRDAYYLPAGFDSADFRFYLGEYAKKLPVDPKELWCPIVSGTMAMALEEAFPKTALKGVAVAKHHDYEGRAQIFDAPEKFVRAAAIPPPYPSWTHSDAKVWRFAKKHGIEDAVIWNSNA